MLSDFSMQNLSELRQWFTAIKDTSKRSEKEALLEQAKENTLFYYTLQYLLDPNVVVGISAKKAAKTTCVEQIHPAHKWEQLIDIQFYLKAHNTGTDYDVAVLQDFLSRCDEDDREFIKEILIKSYRCGVDAKTANKVLGDDFVMDFQVMLAKKYFEEPDYVAGKEFTLTQKLDGVRCIAIKKGESVEFYTRQGKRLYGLTEIEAQLKQSESDFVLDGELLANGDGTSAEQYGATTSILLADGEKLGLTYYVFDMLRTDEFENQFSGIPYSLRRKLLEEFAPAGDAVAVLPVLYSGSDTAKIKECLDAARAANQEGIMININNAPYHYGRTKDLLKVKVMQDCDLRIIGFEEGKGAFAGKLGAIIVDYKGHPLKVGSGYSVADREIIWEMQSELLGRVITVQYFEETVPKSGVPSLRFPVYLRLRESGKEPSYN